MGSSYKDRRKTLKKLKAYEGEILTGREILKIAEYNKGTNISDCYIAGVLHIVEKITTYSKDNKYLINKIDEVDVDFLSHREMEI